MHLAWTFVHAGLRACARSERSVGRSTAAPAPDETAVSCSMPAASESFPMLGS